MVFSGASVMHVWWTIKRLWNRKGFPMDVVTLCSVLVLVKFYLNDWYSWAVVFDYERALIIGWIVYIIANCSFGNLAQFNLHYIYWILLYFWQFSTRFTSHMYECVESLFPLSWNPWSFILSFSRVSFKSFYIKAVLPML